jgi:hypothetical protein
MPDELARAIIAFMFLPRNLAIDRLNRSAKAARETQPSEGRLQRPARRRRGRVLRSGTRSSRRTARNCITQKPRDVTEINRKRFDAMMIYYGVSKS